VETPFFGISSTSKNKGLRIPKSFFYALKPTVFCVLCVHKCVHEKIREKARRVADGNLAEVDRLLGQKVGTEKQRKYRLRKK
jgi:hypothetical protein